MSTCSGAKRLMKSGQLGSLNNLALCSPHSAASCHCQAGGQAQKALVNCMGHHRGCRAAESPGALTRPPLLECHQQRARHKPRRIQEQPGSSNEQHPFVSSSTRFQLWHLLKSWWLQNCKVLIIARVPLPGMSEGMCMLT